MQVKLPRTITLNHITAIIGILCFLFGVLSAVLYIKWTTEQNTMQINELYSMRKDRIKEVDGKFEKLDQNVNDLRVGQAEIKAQVQGINTALAALTSAVIRPKTAQAQPNQPICASYEVQN